METIFVRDRDGFNANIFYDQEIVILYFILFYYLSVNDTSIIEYNKLFFLVLSLSISISNYSN